MTYNTQKQDKISILIVDDHFAVRMGLAAMINMEADMVVAAEADDGQQAVEMCRQYQPNIVLMDLRMPNVDGLAAIKNIRTNFPQSRIIVLTTYDGDEDIHRSLEAGANGYVLKNMPSQNVLEAIRAVHNGRNYIPSEISARLDERHTHTQLSPRELEVLKLIVEGLSNKEIANTLSITEGTVKIHINNILSKLGVSHRTQAATAAIKRGLVQF